MSDGRCATCRHWRKPEMRDNEHYYPGWQACHLASRGTLPAAGAHRHVDHPPLVVESGHDEAELMTAPTFGCVAWAAKE